MERQLHKSLVAERNFNRQVATDVLVTGGFSVLLVALAFTQAVPIVMLMTAFLIAVVIVMIRAFGHRKAYFSALISR